MVARAASCLTKNNEETTAKRIFTRKKLKKNRKKKIERDDANCCSFKTTSSFPPTPKSPALLRRRKRREQKKRKIGPYRRRISSYFLLFETTTKTTKTSSPQTLPRNLSEPPVLSFKRRRSSQKKLAFENGRTTRVLKTCAQKVLSIHFWNVLHGLVVKRQRATRKNGMMYILLRRKYAKRIFGFQKPYFLLYLRKSTQTHRERPFIF